MPGGCWFAARERDVGCRAEMPGRFAVKFSLLIWVLPGRSSLGADVSYYPPGRASSACLTIIRLARANSVWSCAVF